MPDERSPLLAEQGQSYSNGPSYSRNRFNADRPRPIRVAAEELVQRCKSQLGTSGPESLTQEDQFDTQLVVLAYALYLVSKNAIADPLPEGGEPVKRLRIREQLRAERQRQDIQSWLLDEFESALDRISRHVQVSDDEIGEEEEEKVEMLLWRKWQVGPEGDVWLSVMDLLLPPYTKTDPSSFLSHPVIRHVLEHTWSNGLDIPNQLQDNQPLFRRALGTRLQSVVTPRRVQLLRLASFLVLFGLTLAIALRPGNWITPYSAERTGSPVAIEVVYFVWTITTGLDAITSLRTRRSVRIVAILPSLLSARLALAGWPNYAFSALALAIPFLTISLVLPYAPSMPNSIHSLLPLSVLLVGNIRRGLSSAVLLVPVAILLFVVFSWALNGDVFRGFYTLSSSIAPAIAHFTKTIALSLFSTTCGTFCVDSGAALPVTLEEPVEPGISPYETRVSIFITILTLVILSISLSASRAGVQLRDYDQSSSKRWRGAVKEGDLWEREFGTDIARRARLQHALAIQDSLSTASLFAEQESLGGAESLSVDRTRGVLVPPLNALAVPLDAIIFLLRTANRRLDSTKLNTGIRSLERVRSWVVFCIMAGLCLPLALIRL